MADGLCIMFNGSLYGRKPRDIQPDLPVEIKEVQDADHHHHHVGGIHKMVGERRLPELTGGGVPNTIHLHAVSRIVNGVNNV